jgi:hypothetical protein
MHRQGQFAWNAESERGALDAPAEATAFAEDQVACRFEELTPESTSNKPLAIQMLESIKARLNVIMEIGCRGTGSQPG